MTLWEALVHVKASSRYHPCDDDVVYTVINASLPRGPGHKTPARRGYILKWNIQTWTVEKHKKVGDKGLTAFDIRSVTIWTSLAVYYRHAFSSLDGRFLGYGSSDLSIGILDTKTLTVGDTNIHLSSPSNLASLSHCVPYWKHMNFHQLLSSLIHPRNS